MTQSEPNPETDRPLYWLVILDQSVEREDPEMATEAHRQLARLGVHVRYDRFPLKKWKEAGHDN